jgi:hypothetical protein
MIRIWSILLVLILSIVARAENLPIVAVFDVEVKGIKIDAGMLDRLTDYLCSLIAQKSYQIVPRSKLKDSLAEKKKESYKQCYDQTCQIEIGQELAAQKSLSTQVLSLGGKCKITLTLYDLKRSTSEKGTTVSGECSEAQIVESLEKAVNDLVQSQAQQLKPSEPQAAPQAVQPAPPKKRCILTGGHGANRDKTAAYIITGGKNFTDPSYARWQGFGTDECCLMYAGACWWFETMEECRAKIDVTPCP